MFGAIWRNKCMYVGIYKKFVLLKFNIFRLSWLNLWMWSLQKRDTSYTKLISIHILVEKSLKHQYKKKQMLLQRGCCFFFFSRPFQEQKNFRLKIQFIHWFMLGYLSTAVATHHNRGSYTRKSFLGSRLHFQRIRVSDLLQ